MSTVLVDKRDDGVALLTLNRPDSLNALGEDMLPRLAAALEDCAADESVRCVALTGAGRAFCAGGDVKRQHERRARMDDSGGNAGAMVEKGTRELFENQMSVSETLHVMAKPTVALVNGHAVGAGQSIALACDIRIASERAKFGTAFRNVGLSGDYGGSYFLQRLIGASKARELYFTGEILDAARAMELGFVSRVVAHESLLTEGLAFCTELAQGPTAAFGRMKANLTVAETGTLADALREEARNMSLSRFGDDHKEAVAAFVEKRTPKFVGH
jgi:2-(1,2-epoxy-1,2-dihydrophenyl)acetyl-CoA isomerase